MVAMGIRMAPVAQAQDEYTYTLNIEHIDQVQYPERIFVSVLVQDADGNVPPALSPDAFDIREQREPMSDVRIVRTPEVITIAVVADIHRGLDATMLTQIGNSVNALVDALPRDEQAFVTTSPMGEQVIIELLQVFPGNPQFEQNIEGPTTDHAASTQTLADISASVRNTVADDSESELYTAIQAAVEASPDSVVVLSNGLDSANDATVLDAAISSATDQDIAVYAVEFVPEAATDPEAADTEDTPLNMLAEATGGEHIVSVVGEEQTLTEKQQTDIQNLAQTISQADGSSTYLLSYEPANLEAQERQVTVQVVEDGRYASNEADLDYTPMQRIELMPAHLDIEASGYPTVTVTFLPETEGYQAVTPTHTLSDDLRLSLDDRLLEALEGEQAEAFSLSPGSQHGAESIGLVVDLRNIEDHAAAQESLPWSFIERAGNAPLDGQSRMALFANSTYPFPEDKNPEVFHPTPDYNRLRNESFGEKEFLNNVGGSIISPLQTAIDATAEDARQAREPAHVVVFTNADLSSEDYDNLLQQARDERVTVHVVTSSERKDVHPRLENLARGTGGVFVPNANASGAALGDLIDQIARARAQTYELQFLSPILGTGETISLTLSLADGTVEDGTAIPAITEGEPITNPPRLIVLLLQGLAFVGTAGLLIRYASTATDSVPPLSDRPPELQPQQEEDVPPTPPNPLLSGSEPPANPGLQNQDIQRLELTLSALAAYGNQRIRARSLGSLPDDDASLGQYAAPSPDSSTYSMGNTADDDDELFWGPVTS
jgi:hypothetical protein